MISCSDQGGDNCTEESTIIISDNEAVDADLANLDITYNGNDNALHVSQDLTLDTTGSIP